MDQITLAKNQYRLEQWTQLIHECRSSGMKVDDWCEVNGVSHHAYYYWLRKIRQATCPDLPSAGTEKNMTSFKRLEVNVPVSGTGAAVIIHLGPATVEIQNGASQQTVEAVLLALKSICQATLLLQKRYIWPVVIQICVSQ